MNTKYPLLKVSSKKENLATNRKKVAIKEEMKITMREDMKTNKKSVQIDKKAANVSMQVSSERVLNQNMSLRQKEALQSVAVCQNQALKSVQLCNDAKVTIMEKHQE